MSRTDIHNLLMLKLTDGLNLAQSAVIDHLISSDVEVSNSWKMLQSYFFDCEVRRREFESISSAELMYGVTLRTSSIRKAPLTDIIALCCKWVLSLPRMLFLNPDMTRLLTFVNSNILDILWTRKGHLSLEKCRSLIGSIADNPILMKSISPHEFEQVIGELFRNDGFQVTFTKDTADGGIDVIVTGETKAGLQKYAIQCKRYRVRKVGIEAVRSLYGVKVHGSFTQAVMVTTSAFTMPAIRFSNERLYELTLKNGVDVRNWCKAYRDQASD